jgi:hypothetical protein
MFTVKIWRLLFCGVPFVNAELARLLTFSEFFLQSKLARTDKMDRKANELHCTGIVAGALAALVDVIFTEPLN